MENQEISKLSIVELESIVDEMIAGIQRMPPHAMMQPLNNFDLINILQLFKSFLQAES